jgi:uncharacterized cupin superfamily protein
MARFIHIDDIPEHRGTGYPPPHDARCRDRHFKRLALSAGISQFGVNLTRLPPGAWASQRHAHSHEEEFILMQQGRAVWIDDDGEREIGPGDMVGVPCDGNAHTIVNRSDAEVVYLAVGSRSPEDWCLYPDIGMKTGTDRYRPGAYLTLDGKPYPAG